MAASPFLFLGWLAAAAPAGLDAALEEFWKAGSPKQAARAAEAIQRTGAGFDELYARLRAGRPYARDVETGTLRWTGSVGGGPQAAVEVDVPRDYDPGRAYPVRVFLHGGVARPLAEEAQDLPARRRSRRRLESEQPLIALYPAGFAEAQWWFANQVENVSLLLDRLKRSYNVDENRVHLMGVSDGGTGVYFFGMRDATAWSALLPFNGSMGVLANPAIRADGELFAGNLAAKPLYVVNGGLDPLYPVPAVHPWLVMLDKAGAAVTFRPQMQSAHDTSWWPEERPRVDAFVRQHARDPLPARLSWRSERTDRYNRLHWLVIDRLDSGRSDAALDDPNTIERTQLLDFGLRVDSSKGDGRRVIAVVAETSAEAMGLRKGDLILAMDDAPIRTAGDIGRAFDAHPAGTPLLFAVERRGQRLRMEAEFPPRPKAPKREQAFPRSRPSGRVDVLRKGNDVEARTTGVAAFTLLLSPAAFDLERPVRVAVNGRPAFEGTVEKSVATLLRWAARDNDRTMLFAAELKIDVP